MGTDIHSIFQAKQDGKWIDVISEYKEDRHYLLFAWLGNVRNGFGFAGIPTHNKVTPLSDRRGFPADFEVDEDMQHSIPSRAHRGESACFYTVEDADPSDPSHLKRWMGDHSYSWVSADEVLNATPPIIRRTGVIPLEEFRKWDGISAPESWCGDAGGPGVLISRPDAISTATSHVRIEWDEDTSKTLAYFVDEVRRLKDLYGEVRFVFGFDS